MNTAAARDLVSCRWTFTDYHQTRFQKMRQGWFGLRWLISMAKQLGDDSPADIARTTLSEDGWYVHHYFEDDATQTEVSVDFYDSAGKHVQLPAGSSNWSTHVESVRASGRSEEKWGRAWLEVFQVSAALLVPLATLATTTITGSTTGRWWELVAIGFGSDTIKSILVGRQETLTPG